MAVSAAMAATALMLHADGAESQQANGNGLLEACSADNDMLQGFCIGYLAGIVEGQSWGAFLVLNQLSPTEGTDEANTNINTFLIHCVPPDASNQQLRDVAVRYLLDNPVSRHFPARGLIWQAYMDAFPSPP